MVISWVRVQVESGKLVSGEVALFDDLNGDGEWQEVEPATEILNMMQTASPTTYIETGAITVMQEYSSPRMWAKLNDQDGNTMEGTWPLKR